MDHPASRRRVAVPVSIAQLPIVGAASCCVRRGSSGLFADGLTIYHRRTFSWRASLRLGSCSRRLGSSGRRRRCDRPRRRRRRWRRRYGLDHCCGRQHGWLGDRLLWRRRGSLRRSQPGRRHLRLRCRLGHTGGGRRGQRRNRLWRSRRRREFCGRGLRSRLCTPSRRH
jgi:hypothetical protein